MEGLQWFLMVMGGATIIAVVGCFGMFAIEAIKDAIHNAKRHYQYKHRFDKPPTAKCYCVDCWYHDNETGRCCGFHDDTYRSTADNWFCYHAEPRKEMVE